VRRKRMRWKIESNASLRLRCEADMLVIFNNAGALPLGLQEPHETTQHLAVTNQFIAQPTPGSTATNDTPLLTLRHRIDAPDWTLERLAIAWLIVLKVFTAHWLQSAQVIADNVNHGRWAFVLVSDVQLTPYITNKTLWRVSGQYQVTSDAKLVKKA
jgi:hypothetical protein